MLAQGPWQDLTEESTAHCEWEMFIHKFKIMVIANLPGYNTSTNERGMVHEFQGLSESHCSGDPFELSNKRLNHERETRASAPFQRLNMRID